nr:hypothetical protein [Nelson Picorna-like virus 3]
MMTTNESRFAIKQAFEDYLARDEEDKIEISFNFEDWPERYLKRFLKWYLRRNDVVNIEKLLSEQLGDFVHHMKNWDSGIRKALLKDKEIDRLRTQLRNDRRKLRKALYKFKNQAVMNPKTRHISYEEVKEEPIGEEQGKYEMTIPTNGKTVKLSFELKEPRDDEEIISYPFTTETLMKFTKSYLKLSPFFRKLFLHKDITLIVNTYMINVQYKQGTLGYYKDWLLGTRRRRDEFVEFMSKFDQPAEEQGDDGQNATNLESTSVTSSSTNITFVDERPVDSASLHTGQETYSRDVHNDIAENDWTLKKVLTREYPLQSIEWKVTGKWETPIYTNGVPKIITDDQNCMITRQLQFFSFLRAGIKIRVQLNGTKFHCGRLIVYFKPITWDNDTDENFFSVTCYPHFFLDASVSNSGEISIPFTHLLSHFSQESKTLFNDSINTLGSVNIRVYNPLQAAEKSSQSLFGQIYVALEDPYVHLPTYSIQKFSYGTGYMQGLESLLKKAAGSAINSGLGIADKFTGGLVTGAGDAICNMLGICDKPLDPVSAAPIINRTIAPLSHGAGLDRSTRLGLSPTAQTNTSPAVLGATDCDFNLLTLCKIPCLLDQKEWNVTALTGAKLFDMLVTPVYLSRPQYAAYGSERYTNYSTTMLAYVSRAFCLWRGSLKVKIQVIATQFHSGRLALVYDPHGTHDVNLTDLERNKSHNIIIMDIQEKQELVVELPNFMVKPWLRCDRFRSDASLVDGAGIVNPAYLDCDVAGVFRIFVLNGLVRPDNVTDKVQINIFFYAGDNFELTIPNPVAPLSARRGASGVQYFNFPRYPWCTEGEPQFCEFYEPIMNMYNIGTKLFEQGQLTIGKTWYEATEKVFNQDTLCFVYEGKKIAYFMETAKGACKDLILNLPNYKVGDSGAAIARVDTKTTEILGDLEIIQPAITDVREKVNKIVPKIDAIDEAVLAVHAELGNVANPIYETEVRTQDILGNTLTTVSTLKDVNITTTQINNDIGNLKDNALQATGCYERKIRGRNAEQIQWRKLPTDVCEPQAGEEQAIQSYTTTRDSEGASVTITEGNAKSVVAPDTVSENAMNMQTLLRRFYPLWVSSNLRHSNNFTIVSIPVSPAFAPGDIDKVVVSAIERRYEIHNLAWWSRLYTYWRGSMRYKILVNADDADMYVWHNPVDTKDFHVSTGFSYEHVTEQLNFATDAAVTRTQQGIEVEIPFYSAFNQLVHSHITNKTDLRAQNGTLYVAVRNRGTDFNISMFVSTGDDFFLNVLRAPPIIHEPGMLGYINSSNVGESTSTQYPELQRSMGHTSHTFQIPETQVFDRWSKGVFRNCKIPDNDSTTPQDFRLNELTTDRQQTIPLGVEQGIVSQTLGIDEALKIGTKIHDQFSGINVNLTKVTDRIPTIMSFLTTIKEQVPLAVQTAKDGVSSMNDVATFGKWATNTLMIGTLIVEFADLIKSFTWLRLVKVIVMLCIYMKVEFHQVISWLIKQVQDMYEGYRPKANDGGMVVNEEQGLTDLICDNHDEVVMTMSAIATVIFCGIFGKMPKWKEIKSYVMESISGEKYEEQGGLTDSLRSIHFSVMGARSINAAYEFFTKWVEKFVSWVVGRECKELQMVRAFQEKSQAVIDWLDTIEEMDVDDVVLDALTDVSVHNKVYALVDTGREFTKWTMQEDVPRNISMVIRDANRKLMDLVKRINTHRPGQGFRYAPYVVMLDGESSVAKTNVMHEFTDMFREELEIPYFNSVFPIPTTAKYLDGYSGQTLIEWDDMLQSPLQDELAAEFINWRSNADFKPNMAVAEEKGKIHFLSKAIMLTTNSGSINLNTIRDMNAFRNRINIKFVCHLAEGWTPARVKALQEHDPNYSFMLFDAYYTNETGTGYDLYRRNMEYIDARELTRMNFMRWNTKQINLVNAYMTSHGSLRIPAGVQIQVAPGNEQMMEDEDFVESPETYQTMCGGFVLHREPDLKPEDMDEAQLFEYIFEDLDFVEKLRYYDQYKLMEKIRLEQRAVQLARAGRRSFWSIAKDMFKRGCDEVKRIATTIYEKYPRLIQTLGLITALGTGYALFSTIWTMFESKEITSAELAAKKPTKVIQAEMYEPIVKNPAKIVRAEMYEPVVKNPVKIVRAEGKEQGCDDPEAVEMGRNKIHPLLYNLGWQQSDNPIQLQGLAIGGKVVMAPYHFFRKAKDGDRFYFVRGNDKIEVEFVQKRLYRIRDKDCALYYVGAQFDSRKSILKCFAKEQDLGRLGKKVSAVLLGTTPDGRILEQACKAEANQIIKYKGKDEGAEEFVQVGWKYDLDTVKGQCGSMLIACSKILPPPAKIVGMHTAGYTQSRGGFSIVVTQEQVAETLAKITADHGPQVFGAPIPPQVNTDDKLFEEQAGPKPEGAFTYWGTMDKRFCPSQPQKTCFRKTPFHGEIFESVKKPAALRHINGISPLKKALGKYGKLTSPFKARHIRAVRADILNELSQFESDVPMEPTSLETAVFGLPGIPYCEKMNMNSSPGWPYQCLPNSRGQKGKAYLFDVNARKIKDELLNKNIYEREELAREGERYPSIWRDCMKDELRPNEKVEEGKTRLFTIAPTDYTILVRKYFLAFEQMFYKNHSKFFSAVGINPESYEWTAAYNRLRTYGNKCCAGDFASYDGTLMADLMMEVGDIIDDWYKLQGETDPDASTVRRVLIDEMIHTYQLVNNCVYKTHQGNPSGNPLTVIINTMVNVFYMRLCWLEIMVEKCPKWATLDEYHQNVIEEAYGDDNRIVIREKVINFFNQVTITECLARHGITYTDETKSGKVVPYRNLEETSFLKRSYRFDAEIGKEIILPQIDLSTISEIMNWYRDAEDMEEQLIANMRAALGFAFFHGKDFYEDLNGKYKKAMRDNGMHPISVTYTEQLDRFLAMVHGNSEGRYENFVELGF